MKSVQYKSLFSGPKLPALTKGSAVFHGIRRAILLREIDAGQPLIEQQIGREFNCSQGTVREALMRLQEEGLVQRRGYKGTFVLRSSIAEAAQMADIRIKLEVEGISRAVTVFEEPDLAELDDYLQRMEKSYAEDDAYASSELDRTFHLAIFQRSGLPALEPILKRCMLHMHMMTFGNPAYEVDPISPIEAHRPIMEALRARDGQQAASAIRNHINEVASRWSPQLKSALDALESGPGASTPSSGETS